MIKLFFKEKCQQFLSPSFSVEKLCCLSLPYLMVNWIFYVFDFYLDEISNLNKNSGGSENTRTATSKGDPDKNL